jgi:hypothetical protein
MWLLLYCDGDESALWAAEGLARRGLTPLMRVTSTMLASASRWEHCVEDTGSAYTRVALADGVTLDSRAISGTLNRLDHLPWDWPGQATAADRDYAASELLAFFASWLHSLPAPVVNPPSPGSLAGPCFSFPGWVMRAARAGLATATYREESRAGIPGTHTVTYDGAELLPSGLPTGRECGAVASRVHTLYVVGPQVFTAEGTPAPPQVVREGCQRLAGEAGAVLLGVDFLVELGGPEEQWLFVGATPLPDLRPGGEVLLDALSATLGSPAGARTR